MLAAQILKHSRICVASSLPEFLELQNFSFWPKDFPIDTGTCFTYNIFLLHLKVSTKHHHPFVNQTCIITPIFSTITGLQSYKKIIRIIYRLFQDCTSTTMSSLEIFSGLRFIPISGCLSSQPSSAKVLFYFRQFFFYKLRSWFIAFADKHLFCNGSRWTSGVSIYWRNA